MAQQVQRCYEVAPLDQLSQRAAAEGVFGYFEAGLLGEEAQVHQDLMDREEEGNKMIIDGINSIYSLPLFCSFSVRREEGK